MAQLYPGFKKALQGLHGLTEKEAEAFFSLCGKKIFSVRDVRKVLIDVKAHKKNSRSSAYNVVEKLEKAGLISAVNSNNKKQEYECVHPRAIYNGLKNNLKKVKEELPELETAYETSDFEMQDPREKFKLLKSESEISSACYSLQKNHQITIIHDNSKVIKGFLESIEDCGKIIQGNTNAILFKNKLDGSLSGIIEISKRSGKEANLRLYGYILYDEEKYKYFYKKEVKK